jgi:hypothetical protein
MQKILDLSEKEFLTGISTSSQLQNTGLWSTMQNVTVVGDTSVGNTKLGLLQAVVQPGAPTSAILSDQPLDYAKNITGSDTKVYFIGSSGHLYEYNIATGTATDKRSGTPITNPAAGIFVFKHDTGVTKLYYFQTGQLGQWDLSGAYPTGWTDNYYSTNIASTQWHSVHKMFDEVYFANGNYIGKAIDNTGTGGLTITPRALDFPSDHRVNCIDDDGVYLVAGITANTSTGRTNLSRTRVIFWDKNSSSWNREYDIPDPAILSIKRVGSHMEAVCSRGIYAFSFTAPPQLMLGPLGVAQTPAYTVPTQNSAAVLGEALLWASEYTGINGAISAYGKLTPQCPRAYLQPWGGLSAIPTIIAPDIEAGLIYLVCNGSNALHLVGTTGISTAYISSTNCYAETIFIDLARWWQVGLVAVEFAEKIASPQQIRISLQPDTGVSATSIGTVIGGSINTKEFYTSVEARKLRLKVEFLAGVVPIRRIEVWGDPLERPTHTR